MKLKNYIREFRRLSRGQWYMAVFCSFILGALILFGVEYYSFRNLSAELFDLKEDYRVYALTLKKVLDEQQALSNGNGADQKKKNK